MTVKRKSLAESSSNRRQSVDNPIIIIGNGCRSFLSSFNFNHVARDRTEQLLGAGQTVETIFRCCCVGLLNSLSCMKSTLFTSLNDVSHNNTRYSRALLNAHSNDKIKQTNSIFTT